MEQDIHIEDMQESVQLYGRMCRKIEAAMREIQELARIGEQYQAFAAEQEKQVALGYRQEKLKVLQLREEIRKTQEQLGLWQADLALLKEKEQEIGGESDDLERQYHEINIQLHRYRLCPSGGEAAEPGGGLCPSGPKLRKMERPWR